METKLQLLAKSSDVKLLLEVLNEVKDKIADVRTKILVKPELENAVRLGTIQMIDEHLVDKLKVISGVIKEKPDVSEHE
jgi:hypothetical protein